MNASAPEPRTWTDEDVRFVIADCLKDIDATGRRLARTCIDYCADKVRQIHTELGKPEGFDPYVYALIYARGKFEAIHESEKVIAQLEDQAEQDANLITSQAAMIVSMKKALKL